MSRAADDVVLAGDEALHSALASIPGVSVIVFDHALRIRALHGTALQRHGYVHERMVGRLAAEALRPPAWEQIRPFVAQSLDGQTVTTRQRSEDGTAVYESTFAPVSRGGRVVAATMTSRDITAQTDAEEKLCEAKGRLQAILDNSPMAIYLRDLDERWVVANAETCGIIGKPAEEIVGRPMSEAFSPEVFAELAANDRAVIASGQPQSFEEIVADTRTGNVRHVWSLKFPVRDADGRITGLGGVSLDVTDRERAARELEAARALSDAMFASAPVGMLVSRDHEDGTTEIVQCNAAFARMLGHEPSDLLGTVGPVIVHPDDLPIRARLLENIRAGLPASAEVRYIHRNGQEICALTGLSLVHGPEGERLIVVQAVDISERKDLELRLQHQADRDALTGLYSRRRFLEELDREVVRSRRYERIGALLLLDLDGFKQVNDSFGHATGDDLLIRIGDALRGCLRESDVLARIGGDEFAAILPDTDADGARAVAAKLIAAVRANGGVAVGARRADVTASIGITLVTGTALLNAAELLSQADVAMYWAKDSGKARFAVYARDGAVATG